MLWWLSTVVWSGVLCSTTYVTIHSDEVIRVSRTITTLQVVNNPILDRVFHPPGKSPLPNPIHDNAFASLAALGADMVRYVPWFPYPQKAVGELIAPVKGKPTSWNFTHIIPQLEDFMSATYGKGHTTLINFSTQPCWLFDTPDCSFPANPDQSDFKYVRGKNLKDPTAGDLAIYYGRLLQWLRKGEFVDEHGVKHTGGPKYNLTHWELFNEAEHGYTVERYTHDYDVVVSKMREMADTDHNMEWCGIGGASPSWIPYFLNRSNHHVSDIPLDWVSVHFYASCRSRTDPKTYVDFFARADGFIHEMQHTIIPARDAHSPTTKLDLDELGVIMPDDNNPNWGPDGNLPDMYWNAAGSMYAYLFGRLASLGVEALGHSQLAGSPKIPEWNIPLPQYPSVSLLSWHTGHGNARYWVLKLLLDHFGPGDALLNATVDGGGTPGTNPFCGESDGPAYGPVTLRCVDKGSTVKSIEFADWGTPLGKCGDYHVNTTCSAGSKTIDYVRKQCLGHSTCELVPYPTLGDPCKDVIKRFVVQATCSGPHGGVTTVQDVYALGVRTRKSDDLKVLLVNRGMKTHTVVLRDDQHPAARAKSVYVVDSTTGPVSSPNGIHQMSVVNGTVTLLPYATAVAVF